MAWALAWGVGRAVAPPGAVTAPGVPGEEPAPPVAAMDDGWAGSDRSMASRNQSWAPLVGPSDPTFLDRIDDGRMLVQDATLEDLSDLRDALSALHCGTFAYQEPAVEAVTPFALPGLLREGASDPPDWA